MKNDLQKLIIRNVQQSQISSALKNILNLGKIKYFEKNNTMVGFDYKKLLDVEPSINLEFELRGEKIPLINKKLILPHSEAFQAAVWHCLVSHPMLQSNKTKW